MNNFLPCVTDVVTVKTSTVESIISFINKGDYNKALEYLTSVIDFEFRANVLKQKADLLFRANHSVTSAERGAWQSAYNDFVKNSLF